jgi:Glycosyltransferase like family
VIAAAVCVGNRETYERYAAPALARALGNDSSVMEIESDSIFSGYNQALDHFADRADLEALVLLHQDVAINDAEFTRKVRTLLVEESIAVIGAIGARNVRNSAWWTGEAHGQVKETRGVMGPGRERALVDCVDGIVLILSRWAVQNLRFDDQRFHGFHAYDVDICLQAVAAGKHVVVEDLDVFHHANIHAGLRDRESNDRESFWTADATLRAKWQALGRPMSSDDEMMKLRLTYDQAVSADRRDASEALVEVALAHWAAGDASQAVQACADAIVEDPFFTLAKSAHEALQRAAHTDLTKRPFEGRAFITLADGARLIQDPALLTAYGAQFSGEDDASLLILVAPKDLAALGEAVEAAGLAGPDDADLTAVASDQPFAAAAIELAPHVHALLEGGSARGLGEYRVSADRHGLPFLHALAKKRARAS